MRYGKGKEEGLQGEASSLPKNANVLKHDFFCQRLFKFILSYNQDLFDFQKRHEKQQRHLVTPRHEA